MVGAAAQNARAEPFPLLPRRHRIRFAGNVPVAVRRAEVAPLLASEIHVGMRARAAMVHLVWPDVLLEIFFGGEHRPGFQQSHADASLSQDFHGCTAACARTDYDYVEYLGRTGNLQHGFRYI